MKEYASDQLRNVVFVGHQGSGKTTLAEAILFNAGALSRMGRIEDRNTASDWDEEEKERGLSLSTALLPIEFMETKINILDTPGYTDFQGEIKNAIRVADSVVVVVDAVAGVEVGTELAWQYAEVYQQPIIVTINKLDRENASFQRTLDGLQAAFPHYKFIPIMIPIGEQADFKGVVNLLTMKAYYEAGQDRSDLPAHLAAAAQTAHMMLVEAAAEAEDHLIEKYFAEGDLTAEEIRDGMRKAAKDAYLKTVPVFVTSGARNIGTLPLMEALVVYVSPPTERRVRVEFPDATIDYKYAPQSDAEPFAAYVFKTTNDRFVGALNYFRVFSGSVHTNQTVYNATRGTDERLATLLVLRGKEHIPVAVLHAGDIGVAAKLQHTRTGDALTTREHPLKVQPPAFPYPLYAVALHPKTQADSAKMGQILTSLCESDPTLRWRQDAAIHQTIFEGMGELHIAVAVSRAEKLGVGMTTEKPKVPYREAITKTGSATYRHKKQTGGAGQFGEVTLRVEPNPGAGYELGWQVVGGAISQSFLGSIDKGIQSVFGQGVIAGYPVSDVKVFVTDGKEHAVDSKPIAFEIAGREAFKEAFAAAGPALLEPIMAVQITVPEVMMGDILSDLNTRRARVQGMETEGSRSIVSALVPMAEMLRYGNDLRSLTGGRGVYTLHYSHHDPVPAQVAAPIIAAHKVEATKD